MAGPGSSHGGSGAGGAQSEVVELRFFDVLSVEETAEVLCVPPITSMREWKSAKASLYGELAGPTAHGQ